MTLSSESSLGSADDSGRESCGDHFAVADRFPILARLRAFAQIAGSTGIELILPVRALKKPPW
jgi:hypothetical protein